MDTFAEMFVWLGQQKEFKIAFDDGVMTFDCVPKAGERRKFGIIVPTTNVDLLGTFILSAASATRTAIAEHRAATPNPFDSLIGLGKIEAKEIE